MVDTAKNAAAKAEAAAKDTVSKVEQAAKENGRRGAETVRAAARAASDTAESVQEALRTAAFEIAPAIREAAERGVRQLRDAYDRYRAVAEDTTDLIEESYSTAARGVTELQLKALDVAKANTNAAFDLMRDLVNATSVSEAVELQTAFVRKQFEAFTEQAKDVAALTSKVTADTAGPVRSGLQRSTELIRRAS
jgi:phasin